MVCRKEGLGPHIEQEDKRLTGCSLREECCPSCMLIVAGGSCGKK